MLYFQIEELYASLSKKNADLYIQRMKCLRKNAKPRTRLMEVSFTAIKLYVLSDSSLTGNENVRNFIKVGGLLYVSISIQ